MTENTGEKQGRFKKGQSGNPAGKPIGARHKTTLAIQALLDGEAEEIARRAVEAAKGGDMTAIRLVLERVLPARKDSPVYVDLPAMTSVSDAAKAMSAILAAVAAGEITPTEGDAIAALIEKTRRLIETEIFEARISALEAKNVIRL